MFYIRQLSLSLFVLSLALSRAAAQAPTTNDGQTPSPKTSIIIERQVAPEVVTREANPASPLGMNYSSLVPVMIKAIQEKQTQLETKDAKIYSLEARLAALEQALQQLLEQQTRVQSAKRQQ